MVAQYNGVSLCSFVRLVSLTRWVTVKSLIKLSKEYYIVFKAMLDSGCVIISGLK